jgi:hypothetical protein
MSPFSFPSFFSYWIFTWFLCYELGWTSYNPYLWLWIAFIANWLFTFAMIYYQNDFIDIFLFLFINLLIKGVPIWMLGGSVIRKKDILFGLLLVGIYLVYLAWNDTLFHHNVFYAQIRAIQTNQPITPFVRFVKHWMAY